MRRVIIEIRAKPSLESKRCKLEKDHKTMKKRKMWKTRMRSKALFSRPIVRYNHFLLVLSTDIDLTCLLLGDEDIVAQHGLNEEEKLASDDSKFTRSKNVNKKYVIKVLRF